jgi:hypothetical protein
MTTTPETERLIGDKANLPDETCVWVEIGWLRRFERERDEARMLCRWAFPRLRAMCQDRDATGTGWCCEEEMASHPEIFQETK